jgi:BA14K-like protein
MAIKVPSLWRSNARSATYAGYAWGSDQMKVRLVYAGMFAWFGGALLLTEAGGAAFAQVTGTVTSGADRTEQPAKDEPPPGGCMPIGVTASGEIVFPFLCKGFIEQHKAANQRPAAPDDAGPNSATAEEQRAAAERKVGSADDKSAAKQPDSVAPRTAESAPDAAKAAQDTSPKPVAAEEHRPIADAKPESAEDKSVAKPPDNTASIAKSSREPAEPAPSRERERSRKSHEGSAGPPGCTRFRSYDASSGSYTDYSGRRRACRS